MLSPSGHSKVQKVLLKVKLLKLEIRKRKMVWLDYEQTL